MQGTQGPERSSAMPMDTQLMSSGTRIQIQVY
jgi:hypothetical protein